MAYLAQFCESLFNHASELRLCLGRAQEDLQKNGQTKRGVQRWDLESVAECGFENRSCLQPATRIACYDNVRCTRDTQACFNNPKCSCRTHTNAPDQNACAVYCLRRSGTPPAPVPFFLEVRAESTPAKKLAATHARCQGGPGPPGVCLYRAVLRFLFTLHGLGMTRCEAARGVGSGVFRKGWGVTVWNDRFPGPCLLQNLISLVEVICGRELVGGRGAP